MSIADGIAGGIDAARDVPEAAQQHIGGVGGLRFDSGMLDRLGSSMDQITDVLANAGGMARNDAKAAGEEALGEVLVDFADDWRKTRQKMLKDIDSFTSMVDGVVKAFGDLESNLTQAITPPPSVQRAAATTGDVLADVTGSGS